LGPIVTDIPDQTARAVEVAEAALKPARAHSTSRAGSQLGTNHRHTTIHADLDTAATDLDGTIASGNLHCTTNDATTYENHIERKDIAYPNDLTIS